MSGSRTDDSRVAGTHREEYARFLDELFYRIAEGLPPYEWKLDEAIEFCEEYDLESDEGSGDESSVNIDASSSEEAGEEESSEVSSEESSPR